MTEKKVTVIGGGTGTFVVLSGLKKLPIDIAAVVTMMDSGGSTGRLRDQLGVLPPGDVRQCLVALSEATDLWRKLFVYRFDSGDLQGHTFGNLFISALEKVSSNYDEVLETAEYVLKTKGKVFPVTYQKAHLCVEYENGKSLKGEGLIDENILEKSKIRKAYLDPEVQAEEKAIQRILDSDVVIVGPGDLYTSIIPVFLPKGIIDAFVKTKAKIIYIMNLMTKRGQTTEYKAMDFIHDFQKYSGRNPDIVLYNNNIHIPKEAIDRYQEQGENTVTNDITKEVFTGVLIEEDVLDGNIQVQHIADTLPRSIIRHDSQKLARVLQSYCV